MTKDILASLRELSEWKAKIESCEEDIRQIARKLQRLRDRLAPHVKESPECAEIVGILNGALADYEQLEKLERMAQDSASKS
ncbi:MAG: hypothetical protein ERJ68_02590 [Aphanocapsa feldmannii 277cI]|uniref:Uncharacterized protein n=1 Tax=Aphanocapsa feldmannii 277cI TaxID=2507554 RepID=A0A524RVQ3_9CHRO|nr:MAG: hypothetical protein ERJ68_02590 [Aphanocapsa feldmannii 277cI]